jgi:hypothetical protein
VAKFTVSFEFIQLRRSPAMDMHTEALKNYVRVQQSSLQWGHALMALGAELSDQFSVKALRQMFVRTGRRMADEAMGTQAQIETIKQLQERLNELWRRTNWGWVDITEGEGRLEVLHFCAPLADTLGQESLAWSVGLLEGFYAQVFRSLGSGDAAVVAAQEPYGDGSELRIHFSY